MDKWKVKYYSKTLKLKAEHEGTLEQSVLEMFPDLVPLLSDERMPISHIGIKFDNGATCTIDKVEPDTYENMYPEVNSAFRRR